MPALLELLRLPYTGSGVLALAVTLDKPTTKDVLRAHGVATPPWQVFYDEDERLDPALRFPLFVKPAREGSGMGVSGDSVVRDLAALRARVAYVRARYRQPALVERFVRGREVTVGLVGNRGATVEPAGGAWSGCQRADGLLALPVYEVDHARLPASEGGAYTHRVKGHWDGAWVEGREYHCPARLDLRLDADDGDRPYVLEINALPGLAPGVSDLCYEAAAAGIDHGALVLGVLAQARARLGL